MGHIGVYGELTQACDGSAVTIRRQSNKYAFNRRLKRDNCPLNATHHVPRLRKDKNELLFRLAANGGKKMHSKNQATQKFIFALEKNYLGFGEARPPVPHMDPPLTTTTGNVVKCKHVTFIVYMERL